MLAALFVVLTAISAVTPRAPQRSIVLASPSATPSAPPTLVSAGQPTPTLEPRLPPLLPGVDRPSMAPRTAKPLPAPVALAAAPEAGGIVFSAGGRGEPVGVWRYDGKTGAVRRVGSSGGPTVDGTGYVVREDDAHYVRIDARTGAREEIAPLGALGADAAPAGSDLLGAYVEGAAWVMPRSRAPWKIADLWATAVRVSPDGKRLAIVATSPPPADRTDRRLPNELWVVDLPHGTPRLLVRLQQGAMGPTFQLARWSPDSTLLTYFEISISGSMNADGGGLRAIDVRTATVHDLGVTLFGASRLSWAAAHTLAYVAGGNRMTWDHKTVRIWSPEDGTTNVTTAGIGLNPSWTADGRALYLITADEHDYDPLRYFAGRDSGDRRLSVYDTATRTMRTSPHPPDRVYEGARPSRDGRSVLVMWRPTYTVTSLSDLPPIALTLGLLDTSTGRVREILRIAGDIGFGYYGGYDGPEGLGWSEGR